MHKLTLEVELDAQAIAGKLSDDAGYSVQFGGWLGLASALDGYLNAAGAPPRPEPIPRWTGPTKR